jgi:hypothetical protein
MVAALPSVGRETRHLPKVNSLITENSARYNLYTSANSLHKEPSACARAVPVQDHDSRQKANVRLGEMPSLQAAAGGAAIQETADGWIASLRSQ